MIGYTKLRVLLDEQRAEYGANEEVAPGCWAVFAILKADDSSHMAIEALIKVAPFPIQSGESEDSLWALHYVEAEHRGPARFWLDDLICLLDGRIRKASPEVRKQIESLIVSPMPHRVARELANEAAAGNIPPGAISDYPTLRALLDRSHRQEPMFLNALQIILEAHLVDLKLLFTALISEDIALGNDLTKGSLSRDPFIQTRQNAAAAIRDYLIQNKILNPLDQQKHTDVTNPYVALTDLRKVGRDFILRVDGRDHETMGSHFIETLHRVRRQVYRGIPITDMGTNAPWVTEDRAYPMRYIAQKLGKASNLPPLVWLYMLERAMDG
ncbi:MAG: hypothetical protein SynsKO_18920 [Synoicihabitans sp.]